jgi:glutamate--cysteine ligase
MYFVNRGDTYHDVSGKSFKEFMNGTLKGFEGELPTIKDWEDHMSTLFPEVRLKKFLEMRGADGGTWSRICALPALWVGLLYDDQALDQAYDMIKDWTPAEHQALRNNVPRDALNVSFRNGTVQDLSKQLLDISAGGLERRAELNNMGEDERVFLKSLYDTVKSGKTTAQRMLDCYHGAWNGDISKIFKDCSF